MTLGLRPLRSMVNGTQHFKMFGFIGTGILSKGMELPFMVFCPSFTGCCWLFWIVHCWKSARVSSLLFKLLLLEYVLCWVSCCAMSRSRNQLVSFSCFLLLSFRWFYDLNNLWILWRSFWFENYLVFHVQCRLVCECLIHYRVEWLNLAKVGRNLARF